MRDNRAGPRVPAVTRCLWRVQRKTKLEARCNEEQSAACVVSQIYSQVHNAHPLVPPPQKSVGEAVVGAPTTNLLICQHSKASHSGSASLSSLVRAGGMCLVTSLRIAGASHPLMLATAAPPCTPDAVLYDCGIRNEERDYT